MFLVNFHKLDTQQSLISLALIMCIVGQQNIQNGSKWVHGIFEKQSPGQHYQYQYRSKKQFVSQFYHCFDSLRTLAGFVGQGWALTWHFSHFLQMHCNNSTICIVLYQNLIGSPVGRANVSLSANQLVVEVYIKGTVVVSNMLLQHFQEALYKPERLKVTSIQPIFKI